MALSKTAHIVTAYGEELDQLADELARMGGMVETQLETALAAIVRRDASLVAGVREREGGRDHRTREPAFVRTPGGY